jgi:hypothetical protein
MEFTKYIYFEHCQFYSKYGFINIYVVWLRILGFLNYIHLFTGSLQTLCSSITCWVDIIFNIQFSNYKFILNFISAKFYRIIFRDKINVDKFHCRGEPFLSKYFQISMNLFWILLLQYHIISVTIFYYFFLINCVRIMLIFLVFEI